MLITEKLHEENGMKTHISRCQSCGEKLSLRIYFRLDTREYKAFYLSLRQNLEQRRKDLEERDEIIVHTS